MSVFIWRMYPSGLVHFGEAGIGLEETSTTLHADSFAGALIAAAARAGADVAELVRTFCDARLIVSGLFPASSDTLCVPRPVCPPLMAAGTEADARKTLRRLRMIPISDYVKWYVESAIVDQSALTECARRVAPISAEPEMRAHAAVSRNGSDAALYFVAGARFRPGTGLWSLVAARDADALAAFDGAARALEAFGIGGKRAAGFGCFSASREVAPDSLESMLATPTEPATLLSTYIPATGDDLDEIMAYGRYRVREMRGWIDSDGAPDRRRRVARGLAEGSVLPRLPRGIVADVAPESFSHPVVRCGLAIGLCIAPSFLRGAVETHLS
jgi:CRISPR type III-A-associated RAMP protein Csm4